MYLYDEGDRIVGGISGRVWDGVLEIYLVWVHEDYRGEGYGKRLMEIAEAEGSRGAARWRPSHLRLPGTGLLQEARLRGVPGRSGLAARPHRHYFCKRLVASE